MKTLFDLLSEENPSVIRTRLLSDLNKAISVSLSEGRKACTLSIITSDVFSPVPLPGAMLNKQMMQPLEQVLIRFRNEGCEDLFVVLSTLGGEISFPEFFISKANGLGFSRVNTIIPSIAMSAGTLLAMLSDRIIGFSSTSIGPVDPQFVVMTPKGARVVSAVAYRRLIEETLPRLAADKGLGPNGLAMLYMSQDMYLYQESLRNPSYVDNLINTVVKQKHSLDESKLKELKEKFLTNVDIHGKPLTLLDLRDLGFHVVLLDSDDRYKGLRDLLIEYYSRTAHAFLIFEGGRGLGPC